VQSENGDGPGKCGNAAVPGKRHRVQSRKECPSPAHGLIAYVLVPTLQARFECYRDRQQEIRTMNSLTGYRNAASLPSESAVNIFGRDAVNAVRKVEHAGADTIGPFTESLRGPKRFVEMSALLCIRVVPNSASFEALNEPLIT
jgi:hypothetical protein